MKSQLDIYSATADRPWEGPSDDGEPILHSALANPLPGAGTFCRRFVLKPRLTGNYHGAGSVLAAIKSTVGSGKYVGVDNTKALDLRFSARSQDDTPRGGNVGVFCKSFLDTAHHYDPGNGALPAEAFDGYGLSFGPAKNYGTEEHNGNGNNPAVQYLRLWARQGMSGSTGAGRHREVLFAGNPVTQSAWLPATWYRFRFELRPVTDLQHTLKAYVLTALDADQDEEGSWVEAGSMLLTSAFDSGFYTPPHESHRCGFYTAQNAKEYYTNFPNMFLDGFEPRLTNADGTFFGP